LYFADNTLDLIDLYAPFLLVGFGEVEERERGKERFLSAEKQGGRGTSANP